MVDLSQFGSVGALAILVGIIMQFVKPAIDVKFVPLLAIITGVILAGVIGSVRGMVTTPEDAVSYLFGGILAGALAIGGYETLIDKIKSRD